MRSSRCRHLFFILTYTWSKWFICIDLFSLFWSHIPICRVIFKHHLLRIWISISHRTHLELSWWVFVVRGKTLLWLIHIRTWKKSLRKNRLRIAILSHVLLLRRLFIGWLELFWFFSWCEDVAWVLIVLVGLSCSEIAISWFWNVFEVFRWAVVRSNWENMFMWHRRLLCIAFILIKKQLWAEFLHGQSLGHLGWFLRRNVISFDAPHRFWDDPVVVFMVTLKTSWTRSWLRSSSLPRSLLCWAARLMQGHISLRMPDCIFTISLNLICWSPFHYRRVAQNFIFTLTSCQPHTLESLVNKLNLLISEPEFSPIH